MAVCDVVVVSDFTRKTRTEDFRRVPHTNEQNLAVFLNYAPRPLSSRPRPGTSASLFRPWRRSRPGRGGLGSEAMPAGLSLVIHPHCAQQLPFFFFPITHTQLLPAAFLFLRILPAAYTAYPDDYIHKADEILPFSRHSCNPKKVWVFETLAEIGSHHLPPSCHVIWQELVFSITCRCPYSADIRRRVKRLLRLLSCPRCRRNTEFPLSR